MLLDSPLIPLFLTGCRYLCVLGIKKEISLTSILNISLNNAEQVDVAQSQHFAFSLAFLFLRKNVNLSFPHNCPGKNRVFEILGLTNQSFLKLAMAQECKVSEFLKTFLKTKTLNT